MIKDCQFKCYFVVSVDGAAAMGVGGCSDVRWISIDSNVRLTTERDNVDGCFRQNRSCNLLTYRANLKASVGVLPPFEKTCIRGNTVYCLPPLAVLSSNPQYLAVKQYSSHFQFYLLYLSGLMEK